MIADIGDADIRELLEQDEWRSPVQTYTDRRQRARSSLSRDLFLR